MFEEADLQQPQDLHEFKSNPAFEKRFNERKKREELEKARARSGKGFLDNLEESEASSSLPEDETGLLDSDDITMKVMSTISKLRTRDPEIYRPDKKYFDEADFAESTKMLETGRLGKREAPFTYKKMISEDFRRGNLAAQAEAEEESEREETPFETEQRIKREFKSAIEQSAGDDGEELFTVKQKSRAQTLGEEEEFRRFLEKQKKRDAREAEKLQSVWGDTQTLDDGDKFLRKFLLTKGWIDQDAEEEKRRWAREQERADREDEQREAEMDDYEEKLNFRFERQGGNKITTYERDVEETMRQKDSKRAELRKAREERKQTEAASFKTEADVLKQIKREEIEKKVRQLMQAGGLRREAAEDALKLALKGEFSDQQYDSAMATAFDDGYYEAEEEDEEQLKKYVQEVDENIDKILAGTEPREEDRAQAAKPDEDVALKATSNLPIMLKKKLGKEEAAAMSESLQTNLWWYCDNCGRGIRPLEARYDCMECEDYTECKQCSELNGHDHKMKRFIVPEGCAPPQNEQVEAYLERLLKCLKCAAKIDSTHTHFRSKEDPDYVLCESCLHYSKKNNKKQFEKVLPTALNVFKIVEAGDFQQLEGVASEELGRMIDEYHKLDYEDVIAGGLKTRFKYVKVQGEDYKLDDDDMIYADDRVLNRYLSVKKIAPYKPAEISDKHRKKMKKLLSLVKLSAAKNKQMVTQHIELNREEEHLKLLARRSAKYKKKLEKFLEKKERLLRQQERRIEEQEEQEPVKLADYSQVEFVDVNDTGVSGNRLKSYGL